MLTRVYYGWSVASVLFVCAALCVGVVQYSFGVFVTALQGDLGWSRTAINGSLAFFALSGLVSPLVGRALDRLGSRAVMGVSLGFMGVSYLLRPWMTEVWHFYALSVVQYVGFPGAFMIPMGKLVGLWFEQNRGRVMGLTAMGANFGGLVFASLTGVLIGSIGWRACYLLYGLLYLAVIPLVLLVVREGPAAKSRSGDGVSRRPAKVPDAGLPGLTVAEALRTRAFYLLVLGLLFASLTYYAILTQVVPHLESVGISRTRAAMALSVLAVFGMIGKVSFGYLTEKVPARYAVMGSLGCQIAGLLILVSAGASPLVWLFVPIFGLGFGGLGSLIPLVNQETFGLRAYGSIFGLVNLITLSAAFIGPPLVGYTFDTTGSYAPAFLVIAGLFAVGAVVIAFAVPPPWREAQRRGPAPAAAGVDPVRR